eukprot:GSMAST32.ASY1.ANO1.1105.1 assembled CDS
MANSLKSYLTCVQETLTAALCIRDFPSQVVERHNKPEIDLRECLFAFQKIMSKELLMNPIKITRTKKESVLIEPSINSVRVSVKIKQMDDLDTILCEKFTSFIMLRAEQFVVLRRKPVDGYNISFLIMSSHLEEMWRHKVVAFIIEFMTAIDAELSYLKLATSARARIVAKEFFAEFADHSC